MEKDKNKSFLRFDYLKTNVLAKGDALIVGMKRVARKVEDSAPETKGGNVLAYKEISVTGQPPDPNAMLTELRDTTVFDPSAHKGMKLLDGDISVTMKGTKRKPSSKKKKRKKEKDPVENESRKERRARLKREHLAKQHEKDSSANRPEKDDVDRAEIQRQREADRRAEMEREAAKNFAQGVDEEEQEEYEDENLDEYGEVEDDEEVIDLDDE